MKSRLFFCFLIASIATVLPFSVASQNLKGDVNEDGEVDVRDVTALIDIILGGGHSTLTVIDTLESDMVFVDGGTFVMGGTADQGANVNSDEFPTREVTLSSFYISKFEVTQELWEAVTGEKPSNFSGERFPVEQVSWDDCMTFIDKLNALTGKTYRLPTEAEWEYAARGGKLTKVYKYSGSNNVDDVAWYGSNSNKTTHPVGQKMPNELGLYDMSGNVNEWCSDWYAIYDENDTINPIGPTSGTMRIFRGGAWSYIAESCRNALRLGFYPTYRVDNVGLRLVRSAQ